MTVQHLIGAIGLVAVSTDTLLPTGGWGPGLARHTDVGPTSVAFTPYWWVDDLPITPTDPAGGPGR